MGKHPKLEAIDAEFNRALDEATAAFFEDLKPLSADYFAGRIDEAERDSRQAVASEKRNLAFEKATVEHSRAWFRAMNEIRAERRG